VRISETKRAFGRSRSRCGILKWALVKQITNIIKQIEDSIAVAQTVLTVGWCTTNYFCLRLELPCLSKLQYLATILTPVKDSISYLKITYC